MTPDRTSDHRRARRDDWRTRLALPRGVVSTPVGAPDPRDEPASPTAYVPDRLLLSLLADDVEKTRARLEEVAQTLGWTLQQDDYRVSLRDTDETRADRLRRHPWATGELAVLRFRIVADAEATAPDAWELLVRARRDFGPLRGASLDHLLTITPFHSTPFHSTPFHSTPFHSTPFHSTGWDPSGGASPIAVYALQGGGGRQPMAYVGPQPGRLPDTRRPDDRVRPQVGTLDTGCGDHSWLTLATAGFRDPASTASSIGLQGDDSPEDHPDQIGPLDGMIDPVAGHGTFIAGLVHQACPDADIAPWRIMPADGVAEESQVLETLGQIADYAEGHQLDVLSLSFGYYHETPKDVLTDVTMFEFLLRIRRTGTVVVCSAGNDATSRPMYPAAFGHWSAPPPGQTPEEPAIADVDDAAPLVSVGALNPDGHTEALFSNTGRWVRGYAPGAAVMSTVPSWGGGAEPIAGKASDPATGVDLGRATIDPDEYGGGFALWSGTSFAAPLVAGRIAAVIDRLGIPDGAESPKERIARAIAAADEVAPLRP